MMQRIVLAAGVLLGILCLAIAGMHAFSPLLYSPASDSRATDHVNPMALKHVTSERSARIIPLVADIIGTPGSLVLNIRSKDFASASRDLQEYRDSLRNLDTLVIQLDLDESEIAGFRRAGRENAQILAELLNGTERWDDLKALEVRFRESGDTAMETSIRYEGETLKRKIQDLYREYLEQDDIILSTGDKFELDTSGHRKSITEFREIVNSITAGEEEKEGTLAGPGEIPVLLTVAPDRAFYGDIVRMDGQVKAAGSNNAGEIAIFIDSARNITLRTGPDGSFSHSYRVERVRAGTHTVFAVYEGSLFSPIESFTVEAVPSVLQLEPPRVQNGKVLCQGTLFAGSQPVKGAPVGIRADGKQVATAQTKDDGSFSAEIRLNPATYSVRAEFQGEDFPLLPSGSESYEVLVPVPPPAGSDEKGFFIDPLSLVVVSGFLCLSGAGALYYLRRRKPVILPARNLPASPEITDAPAPVPGGEQVSPPALPAEMQPEPGLTLHPGDMRDVSWPELFRRLRIAVSKVASLRYPQSLTPREVCASCRDTRIREFVCRFTSGYEKVMYAGGGLPREEEDRMMEAYRAVLRILGGKDH
ncbi:MAG: hypothetical protein QHH04_04765 [Methanolinea sp.]|nr:hypothetical protein [Methanolinea sp.]